MDKAKQVEVVKQALEGIYHLRSLHYSTGEFSPWQNRVLQALDSAYGKDSAESRRFVNAPGKSFIVRTETGQRDDYDRRLDCYEEVLKSLLN